MQSLPAGDAAHFVTHLITQLPPLVRKALKDVHQARREIFTSSVKDCGDFGDIPAVSKKNVKVWPWHDELAIYGGTTS